LDFGASQGLTGGDVDESAVSGQRQQVGTGWMVTHGICRRIRREDAPVGSARSSGEGPKDHDSKTRGSGGWRRAQLCALESLQHVQVRIRCSPLSCWGSRSLADEVSPQLLWPVDSSCELPRSFAALRMTDARLRMVCSWPFSASCPQGSKETLDKLCLI